MSSVTGRGLAQVVGATARLIADGAGSRSGRRPSRAAPVEFPVEPDGPRRGPRCCCDPGRGRGHRQLPYEVGPGPGRPGGGGRGPVPARRPGRLEAATRGVGDLSPPTPGGPWPASSPSAAARFREWLAARGAGPAELTSRRYSIGHGQPPQASERTVDQPDRLGVDRYLSALAAHRATPGRDSSAVAISVGTADDGRFRRAGRDARRRGDPPRPPAHGPRRCTGGRPPCPGVRRRPRGSDAGLGE